MALYEWIRDGMIFLINQNKLPADLPG